MDIYKDKPILPLETPDVEFKVPEAKAPVSTYQQAAPSGGLTDQDLKTSGEYAKDAFDASAQVTEPSIGETLKASMFTTGRNLLDGYRETMTFPADVDYDPKEDIDHYFERVGQKTADQYAMLNKARSKAQLDHMIERMEELEGREAIMAQRPYLSMVGSLVDVDVVTAFVPVLGTAKWARLGNAALSAGAITAANVANPSSMRDSSAYAVDAVTFGVGGLFAPAARSARATATAVASGTDVAQGAIRSSERGLADSTGGVINRTTVSSEDSALKAIQEEQNFKVAVGGDKGTVNILGTELRIPISAPVGIPATAAPDWATRGIISKTKSKFGEIFESSGERLYRYTGYDADNPINNLLSTMRTQGDNATYAKASIQGEFESLLSPFQDALEDATHKISGASPVWNRGDFLAANQDTMRAFQHEMQVLDRNVLNEIKLGRNPSYDDILSLINKNGASEEIKELQRVYTKSGFAEAAYDRMKHAGLMTDEIAERLPRRSTYVPLRQSGDKLQDIIHGGKVRPETLYKFIGGQIMNMYPNLNKLGADGKKAFSLTDVQLGQKFVDNLNKADSALADMTTTGISEVGMREILKDAGLGANEIDGVISSVMPKVRQQGNDGVRNLRRRIDWDWNASITDDVTGGTLRMADIVDNNIVNTLQDYSTSTASRVALSQYGFKSSSDLDKALMDMVNNRPKSVRFEEAREFAKNLKDQLMGKPTGERMPEALRTLNTLGAAIVLSTSGLWGLVDLVTQVVKVGVVKHIPHIKKGLVHAIKPLKGLSKDDASNLYDVLTQRLSTQDRYQKFSIRYEDNFSVSNGIHERVNYFGQSTRFLNMSESLKRFQVGMLGGIIVSGVKGAAKGSAKDIKFLKEGLKMSDELVSKVKDQFNRHGDIIDNWDKDVAYAFNQKVFFESDNLAFTVRSGELPAFMEHSTVGKIILPFMSYALAMQTKVLQNTLIRDGATGVALTLATQIPVAMLAGMAKNIKDGKDPEDNLPNLTIQGLSALGLYGVLIGTLSFDDEGGVRFAGMRTSPTAYSAFNRAGSVIAKVSDPDHELTPREIKSAIPLVGAVTGLDFALSAFEED